MEDERQCANSKKNANLLCGPYKDYCGRASYDSAAGIFHGRVSGTRDVVTFEGHTIEGDAAGV